MLVDPVQEKDAAQNAGQGRGIQRPKPLDGIADMPGRKQQQHIARHGRNHNEHDHGLKAERRYEERQRAGRVADTSRPFDDAGKEQARNRAGDNMKVHGSVPFTDQKIG